MPTFCRHNRFLERCPICSRTLPDHAPAGKRRSRASRGAGQASGASTGSEGIRGNASAGNSTLGARRPRARGGGETMRVRRELRAPDDGYRSPLVPGLHASSDAASLAEEIAFASGRLARLQAAPPGLFGEIRLLAGEGELERATWTCFLTVYLSPLQGADPFAGVRLALARGETPSLDGIPLGPRTSHVQARGGETLLAYRHWAERAGPSSRGPSTSGRSTSGRSTSGRQAGAFVGEESWTPERRFERVFERLALPGFARMGRYELLVTLGRLGVYELRAGSLHLGTAHGAAPDDLTTLAAKRIFGIGEPIYLERRALALAEALSLPIDVLDLAFANWSARERATLGFSPETIDRDARERARDALGF
ncbi:MAG TPA: hypothetical protein VES65_02660 [Solirubrobacteraceae bacterium]|nr:hypothetical protein [Solirubrobacteraceae bacterium]